MYGTEKKNLPEWGNLESKRQTLYVFIFVWLLAVRSMITKQKDILICNLCVEKDDREIFHTPFPNINFYCYKDWYLYICSENTTHDWGDDSASKCAWHLFWRPEFGHQNRQVEVENWLFQANFWSACAYYNTHACTQMYSCNTHTQIHRM